MELRPGYSPLDSLTDALAGFSLEGPDNSDQHLIAARRSRVSFALRRSSLGIAEALEEMQVSKDAPLLILVDQFEELFRYDLAGITQRGERLSRNQRQDAATRFVQLLLEASRSPSHLVHVLITMRSDFIGECARFYGLPEAVSATQFLVPSLTRDQREEVIRRPIESVDAAIEPALIERLINDSGGELDELPILQHCLLRLWEQAEKAPASTDQIDREQSAGEPPQQILLTQEHYRAIGELSGAISRHADEILSSLPGLQLDAEQVFRALSEVDVEGRATRRALSFEQIIEESGLPEQQLRRVVDRFRADDCSFLLPAISEQQELSTGTSVDVGHEALLRRWERISGKLGDQYALAEQRNGWLWAEQDDGRFYSGLAALVSGRQGNVTMSLPLGEVEPRWNWWNSRPRTPAWADRYGGHYDDVVRLFDNSLAALQAEKNRQEAIRAAELQRLEEARSRARLYRAAVITFAALFAVALGLSIYALKLKNQATSALDQAQKATATATTSLNEARLNESRYLTGLAETKLTSGDPELAELIALSALPADVNQPERPVWPPAISILAEGRVADKALAILRGHSSTIHSALFDPSGQRVLTAAGDRTARIWDVRSGHVLALLSGHSDGVWYAAFSPDGQRAVTASLDRTARVWDVGTGDVLTTLTGHDGPVLQATFSQDGERILTASADETARLWDAKSGALIARLDGHGGPVETAEFSPDGSYIITTALYDTNAYLWDAHNGRRIRSLVGHSGWVKAAAFTTDGKHVVTASLDKTARVWDVESSSPPVVLQGHTNTVERANFSPDGTRVVTASDDQTARVWDARSGRQLMILQGHTGELLDAEYSSDGRRIVTAAADGTARLWDAENGILLAIFRADMHVVNNASFSADGRRVVTASEDAVARIWDASDGDMLHVLNADAGSVEDASFSPDGHLIVSFSQDMAARVWNADSGAIISVLEGHHNVLAAAQFSPDGKLVATASVDETARIFDALSGTEQRLLRGHTDELTSVQFSSDGQQIVTSSRDETARLWQTQTGNVIYVLNGHQGAVTAAIFSPDDHKIATASADKTARIWDVATGASLQTLSGHDGPVLDVEFSPHGDRVVTASEDGTARIWNSQTGAPGPVLRGHEGRVLAAEFSPDGNQILTASDDKTARLWDASTGSTLCILSGHSGPVRAAKYNHTGDRILTASDDQTSRIWDARNCAALAVLKGHTGAVKGAAFSPDGKNVVTASDDKTLRVWKTWPLLSSDAVTYASESKLRDFTDAERESLFSSSGSLTDEHADDSPVAMCDNLAGDPFDPNKRAPGVSAEKIDVERTEPVCQLALKSAANEPRLQYELGRALAKAGHIQDALAFYKSAADKRYAAAQFALASLYVDSGAGKPDLATIDALYRSAATGDYLRSYYELAKLRWQGFGSAPNRKEALDWLFNGAMRGDPFSHLWLADLYERGQELTQSSAEALLHYTIASRLMEQHGDDPDTRAAQEYRGALARSLEPSLVVKVARDARDWKPSAPGENSQH